MNSLLRNPVLAAALSSSIADGRPPETQRAPTGHHQSLPRAEPAAATEAVVDPPCEKVTVAPHDFRLPTASAAPVVSPVPSLRLTHATHPRASFRSPPASTWVPSPAASFHTFVASSALSSATSSGQQSKGNSSLAAQGPAHHRGLSRSTERQLAGTECAVRAFSCGVETPGEISSLSSGTTAPLQPFASTTLLPHFFGIGPGLCADSRRVPLLSFFRPPLPVAAAPYAATCSAPSQDFGARASLVSTTRDGHHSPERTAKGLPADAETATSVTAAAARTAATGAAPAPAAAVARAVDTAALTNSVPETTEAACELGGTPSAGVRRAEESSSASGGASGREEAAAAAANASLRVGASVSSAPVKVTDCGALAAASRQLSQEGAAAALERAADAFLNEVTATTVRTRAGAAAGGRMEDSSAKVATCSGTGSAAADTAAAQEAGTSPAEARAAAVQTAPTPGCFRPAALRAAAAAAEAGEGKAPAAVALQGAAGEESTVSTFLRGGRAGNGGGEWTDAGGGNDRQEEVIFTGSGDALFFPAFPVHRCRGVSLWDVETNERVCLGKFEETGGLLLLTPETLAKLALSFRTPFFDGVVLRAFAAPPGGAPANAGHSQAHQHQQPHRHRQPATPPQHSPAATRNRPAPSNSGAYIASNRRASASSGSPGNAAPPAAVDGSAALPEKRAVSAAARIPAQAVAGPPQGGDGTIAASPEADLVRKTEGEPALVRERRKSFSQKRERQDEQRTVVSSGEAISPAAEEEDAVSRLPRAGEARREEEAHAAGGGAEAQESQREGSRRTIRSSSRGVQSSSRRDKEESVDAHGERQQQRSQPGAVTDNYRGHRASGEHRSSASSRATEAPAAGAAARTSGAHPAAGEGATPAGSETGRRRSRRGGPQEHASAAPGRAAAAEGAEILGGRVDADELGGRRARERRERQSLSRADGGTGVVSPATGRPRAAGESVRALEGVLIDPEELLQAMEAKQQQQHVHASVDGQWMQFERPRHNTEYKLCIGESYWMAMKIPLEACNPFLLNRNDVVVDLIEPQQQQQQEQLPREAAAPQRRQSRSSGSDAGAAAAAAHGRQQQPEKRGSSESAATAVRSKSGGTRVGVGGETAPEQGGSPSRPQAGSEEDEFERPRSFTGWIGNRMHSSVSVLLSTCESRGERPRVREKCERCSCYSIGEENTELLAPCCDVYDRINRIVASAPTGLTNAAHRLADSLPTTPEEAEDLGKKWSEQSLRAARAVSASAKLLMRSFRHAAAELWLFITEGRSGSGSTGGGVL